MSATTAKKPSGTKTTEIIIGSSAANLSRGLESLRKLNSDLENFDKLIEEKTLKTADLEEKIERLNAEFIEKRRTAEVNFQNDLKENEMSVIQSTLHSQNKVAISNEELEGYRSLKNEFDKRLNEAVNVKMHTLSSSHASELALLKANNERDNAQRDAKVTVLQDKIDMLQKQVESYETMIAENRKAETERARATAIQYPVGQQMNKS
jgi:cell division protein FtsB